MVLRVRLRWTILVRLAEGQSRYSVESAVVQKFRSWASVLSAGSFFLIISLNYRAEISHLLMTQERSVKVSSLASRASAWHMAGSMVWKRA